MHLILLPGNSPFNKEWIDEVKRTLKDLFDSAHIQYYDHWDNSSDQIIDIDKELSKLMKHAKDYDEYCIFAKSAGTIITLKGIKEKKIAPQECYFTGMPLVFTCRNNLLIEDLIANYSTPTLFIQKTKDPAASFADIKKLLEENNVQNYKTKGIPGNSHHYADVEQLKDLIKEFLEKQ